MITNLISGLLAPCFALYACAKSRRYWRQCRRLYTFQPIYRTSGALLAVELLTAVYHPNEPDKRQSPEQYFASLGVAQRLRVIRGTAGAVAALAGIVHSPRGDGVGQYRRHRAASVAAP